MFSQNPDDYKFDLPGFVINRKKRIGVGSFGEVYLGTKENQNQQYAIKIIQLKKYGIESQAIDEIKKTQLQPLQQMDHKNIVKIIQHDHNSHYFFIVQQKCDYDLKALIDSKNKLKKKLTDNQCFYIIFQICQAFKYLSQKNIIHRDLKPANVLIKDGIVKIADFGLIRKTEDKNTQLMTRCGTPLYMPPQLLEVIGIKSLYNEKFDVWATGCIAYELFFGQLPWRYQNVRKYIFQKFKQTTNLEDIPQMKINKIDTTYQVLDFLNSTLILDKKRRKYWNDLLKILDQKKKKYLFESSEAFKMRFLDIINEATPCQNKLLNKWSNNLIKQSSILDKEGLQLLIKWLIKPIEKIQLKFKASQNEFSVDKYYQRCGKLQNTIIIAKTQKGKILGGYTPLSFYPDNDDREIIDYSKSSFLFSLSVKAKFELKNNKYAISISNSLSTIAFYNAQFLISDKSNTNNLNDFSLNSKHYAYDTSKYPPTKQSYQKITGQSYISFKTAQWQVYQVFFS